MLKSVSYVVVALLVGTPAYAQDITARIDSIFSFATSETPGCAVGVSLNGKAIVNRAYGLADVDRRVAMSPRTAFDIGSVHKQFVAAAVILLVEDGRLSLSDDIRKYLPELPDYGHTITIDHLLTHTSGLRDWTGLLPLAPEGTDVLELILRQRGVNFAPGEEWSYSNSGYVLLKEIVARTSGMSFADFTRSRIFEPLGMKSSAYVADILQGTGERALAYEKEGTAWKPYVRLGNERGGGTVISTPGDLLIWNDALTNGRLGDVVTARLEEPARLNHGRTLTYARGLNVNHIPGGRMVSHSGGAAGYGTWLGRFTDHGLSIAAMCNFEPVSVTSLVTRVANLFLPPMDSGAPPPGPVAAPNVEVSGRAGTYFDTRTGEPMRLIVNNGRLTIIGGPPLVPVSAERFSPPRTSPFFRSEAEVELVFRSSNEFELKSTDGQSTSFRRAKPWTPTAADIRSVGGRYGSDELGSVFEIVPGESGVVMRLERSPERAVEFAAVERDTYMRSAMIIRFRRDASGRVSGLDYGNPVIRNISMKRLGDRVAAQKTPAAPSRAVAADTALRLEPLVGVYEMAAGRSITITLEDGRLHGQPSGGEKRPLVHVSGMTFGVGSAEASTTVSFTLGEDGRATEMVMRQNGNARTLKRVP